MLTTHNVIYALQHIRNVFQKKKCRPFGCKESGNFKEQSSSCVFESKPFSRNREALARKSGTEQVEVGHFVGVDFSCIVTVIFSFRVIDGAIRHICVFVDLAVTNAFKPADSLQTRPEAADTGEHIKKSDCHRASDLFLMLFGHLTFP